MPNALAEQPWTNPDLQLPERIAEVAGMLTITEKRMLYWLARYWYSGQGKICDLGTFLGGSTICFATGLRDADRQGRLIYSYDMFVAGSFELRRDFKDDPPPGNHLTRPIFDENLRGYHDLLIVKGGDIKLHKWNEDADVDAGPIEILFIDIAKGYLTWDHVVREFFPHLIPGRSIVIAQDYLFAKSGPWHHVVMEKLADHFSYVIDTDINSVVFRCTRPISASTIEQVMWEEIPLDERRRLMRQAVDRMDTEEKREILRQIETNMEESGKERYNLDDHRLD